VKYFNYKKTFSVNMLAVADAHYRFLYIAVGAHGSANDAAVFNAWSFSNATADRNNPLNIPCARVIPNTDIETPMVFVADDAYPLKPYLLKSFSAWGLSASERNRHFLLLQMVCVLSLLFSDILDDMFTCAFYTDTQQISLKTEDVTARNLGRIFAVSTTSQYSGKGACSMFVRQGE